MIRSRLLFFIFVACSSVAGKIQAQAADFDPRVVFDEVWNIVRTDFHDPQLAGVDWEAAAANFRPRAVAAKSGIEFAQVVNEMLSLLEASHTALFSTSDPRRYQILGVFDFLAPDDRGDLLEYEGIGIDTTVVDGKVFVCSVYDGFPAKQSGMLYGDEIISVDGKPFQSIDSFRGKSDTTATVVLRRSSDGEPTTVAVPVETFNGRTMFERAMDSSVRIINKNDSRIGYVHVWSYAGRKYQDKLQTMLLFGELADCDALILDLRDGWGGASLEYLNLFRGPIAKVSSRSRDGITRNFGGVWGKPVTLLVNKRSTSGKELFAFGFRKLGLGDVIGETTAGAVLAGRPTLLSNGDVLYLAVADIQVDGQVLEGTGVDPTIPVERPLPWAGGADPPLLRAIESLAEILAK